MWSVWRTCMNSVFTGQRINIDILTETDKQYPTSVLLLIFSPIPVFHPQSKRKQITGSVRHTDLMPLVELWLAGNTSLGADFQLLLVPPSLNLLG